MYQFPPFRRPVRYVAILFVFREGLFRVPKRLQKQKYSPLITSAASKIPG